MAQRLNNHKIISLLNGERWKWLVHNSDQNVRRVVIFSTPKKIISIGTYNTVSFMRKKKL